MKAHCSSAMKRAQWRTERSEGRVLCMGDGDEAQVSFPGDPLETLCRLQRVLWATKTVNVPTWE